MLSTGLLFLELQQQQRLQRLNDNNDNNNNNSNSNNNNNNKQQQQQQQQQVQNKDHHHGRQRCVWGGGAAPSPPTPLQLFYFLKVASSHGTNTTSTSTIHNIHNNHEQQELFLGSPPPEHLQHKNSTSTSTIHNIHNNNMNNKNRRCALPPTPTPATRTPPLTAPTAPASTIHNIHNIHNPSTTTTTQQQQQVQNKDHHHGRQQCVWGGGAAPSRTSNSGPSIVCFVHFDEGMCQNCVQFFMSFLGRDPGLIIFFDPVSEAIFAPLPHESVSIHVNNFFLILIIIFFWSPGNNFFWSSYYFFLIPHPFIGAQVDNMPWALSRPRRANSLQMHCLLWLLKDAIRSGGDGFSEPGVVYGDRTEEFSPKSSGRFSSYTCLRWLDWSVWAAAFSWILIVTLMSFFLLCKKEACIFPFSVLMSFLWNEVTSSFFLCWTFHMFTTSGVFRCLERNRCSRCGSSWGWRRFFFTHTGGR